MFKSITPMLPPPLYRIPCKTHLQRKKRLHKSHRTRQQRHTHNHHRGTPRLGPNPRALIPQSTHLQSGAHPASYSSPSSPTHLQPALVPTPLFDDPPPPGALSSSHSSSHTLRPASETLPATLATSGGLPDPWASEPLRVAPTASNGLPDPPAGLQDPMLTSDGLPDTLDVGWPVLTEGGPLPALLRVARKPWRTRKFGGCPETSRRWPACNFFRAARKPPRWPADPGGGPNSLPGVPLWPESVPILGHRDGPNPNPTKCRLQ